MNIAFLKKDAKPLVNGHLLALVSILSLGLFLRFHNLGVESIWLDEGYSIRTASLSLIQIFNELTTQDVNQPLYYIILHYWIDLFGNSEFAIRSLSAIFGFFAIYMIFKVGSLIFDKEVGILGAMLLSISQFHVYYSQEARAYSLVVLLTLASFYYFVKLLNEKSIAGTAGYILSNVFLLYTHAFGLFTVVAQIIYLVTIFSVSRDLSRLSLRRWITIHLSLYALLVPWAWLLINQLTRAQRGEIDPGFWWWPKPSAISIAQTFFWFSGSLQLLAIFLILLVLSLFAYKHFERIKKGVMWKSILNSTINRSSDIYRTDTGRSYLLILWLVVPIILPFIISLVFSPIYVSRYMIGSSLAFYLLIAKGIREIGHSYVKVVIIGIIIALSLLSIWDFKKHSDGGLKEHWRSAAAYIDRHAKKGDLLIFNAGHCQENAFDYYSKRTDLVKKHFPKKNPIVNKQSIGELSTTLEGHDRVWIILSYSQDREGLIRRTLLRSYSQLHHKVYEPYMYETIEVYLYKSRT